MNQFRNLNKEEFDSLQVYFAETLSLKPSDTGQEEAIENIEAANICVLDYMPDCPGQTGSLIFCSYGAGIEYYQVFTIEKGKLVELKQSSDFNH